MNKGRPRKELTNSKMGQNVQKGRLRKEPFNTKCKHVIEGVIYVDEVLLREDRLMIIKMLRDDIKILKKNVPRFLARYSHHVLNHYLYE